MPEQLTHNQSIDPSVSDDASLAAASLAPELQAPALDTDPSQPRRIHDHRRGIAASFLAAAALGLLGKEIAAPALATGKDSASLTGHGGSGHTDIVTVQSTDEQIKTYSISDFHRLVGNNIKQSDAKKPRQPQYGTDNVLEIMKPQEVPRMIEVLTRPENDPTLESLFFQQQDKFYELSQLSGGSINSIAYSRYSAYLDEKTSPELKQKISESLAIEGAYWQRQGELSAQHGFSYANPNAAIPGILDAQTPEEAVAVINKEIFAQYNTELKLTDDIAADMDKLGMSYDDAVSTPIDRSPKGLKNVKIALALIAHSLADIPTDSLPNIKVLHLANNLGVDPTTAPLMRLPDGSTMPLTNIGGRVREETDSRYTPKDLIRQNKQAFALDIIDVVGAGQAGDADQYINHEFKHVEDFNYFDKLNPYKLNRARAVLEPSVRYKNPSKQKSSRIPLQASSLSYSIGWNRYNKVSDAVKADGSPGRNFYAKFTSLYGSNNNAEDYAESTADLTSNPEYFIYNLISWNKNERFSAVIMKRLAYLDALSKTKRWRDPMSAFENTRARSVILPSSGMK